MLSTSEEGNFKPNRPLNPTDRPLNPRLRSRNPAVRRLRTPQPVQQPWESANMTSAGRGKAHLPHESTRGLPCPPWIATLRPAGVRVKVEIACLRLRVRRGWPRSLAPRRPPAHGRAWFYDGDGIPGETG